MMHMKNSFLRFYFIENRFFHLIDYSGSLAQPGRSSAQPDRTSAHLM